MEMISSFDEKASSLDGDEEKERELFMNLMDDIFYNFLLEDKLTNFVRTHESNENEKHYRKGFSDGSVEGFGKGLKEKYNDEVKKGFKKGYDEGIQKAYKEDLAENMEDWDS